MKVFMLGWEFPPYISGGLGTACHGLTKALSDLGVKITFVLPKPIETQTPTHVQMLTPQHCRASKTVTQTTETSQELKNVQFHTVSSPLQPYTTPQQYQKRLEEIIRQKQLLSSQSQQMLDQWLEQEIEGLSVGPGQYSGDMYTEVHRYAAAAVRLALQQEFDVIHAHDWMTYPAGIAVAAVTGKPLVVHVHSTEFDRSGEHVNQMIYDIERRGIHAAAKVIAVSYLTRNILMTRYGALGEKIEVIYNGVEAEDSNRISAQQVGIRSDEKIVLFLGRITMQKGPEYFLMAARKVLEEMENVKFVMAGSGDMMHRIIEMAAQMGIGHKVLFTGFLRGEDVNRVYQMADLYVMPSVSEPFGIAPLEALNHDVPVIISKQSGVAEVLTHVLKVDFWDIQEMANKIIAVLKYPPLQMTLREHGNFEVRKLKWSGAAKKCLKVYQEVTQVAV
ncbi:MAG TPA: glycosyltransferase family 4 protein [Anaerohalosphaeraceae bacterium]|nr:glycosyltransferase family 4 protein [Anaerohalosphaeraceae bacterium]